MSILIRELNYFPRGLAISSFLSPRWVGGRKPHPSLSVHGAAHRPQAGCSPDTQKRFWVFFSGFCSLLCATNSFVRPHRVLTPLTGRTQELINGLLQCPDARAGLQISVSMCLLFEGWCFNILKLNRRRSAWWGLPHGYSGAQPGAPRRWGNRERGDRTESLLLCLEV